MQEQAVPGRPSNTCFTIVYLLAHFGKSHLWHASTLLFGFFLTEVCGLGAWSMAAIMAWSLAVNGLIDGAIGVVWSGRITTATAAIRLQASAAPFACLFFLLFCATPLLDAGVQMVWAMVTLVAFRISYPFVDVPQNALVAFVVAGADARCALLARRNIASGLASLSVAAIAAPLLIERRGHATWLLWAGGLALCVCGGAWLLRGWTTADDTVAARRGGEPYIPVPLLLAALAVMMVGAAAFRALEPYYAAYAGTGIGLPIWAAAGAIISQPLWASCRRRLGSTTVLAGAAALLLLAAAASVAMPRGVAGAVAGAGFGAGTSGLWLILWSMMMAHAATGQATAHVGLFTCVSKLAQAIAMLLLGQVLTASPYRTTLADPWSLPSLSMAASLCAVAAVCGATILLARVNRTPCGERRERRHRAGPIVRVRG